MFPRCQEHLCPPSIRQDPFPVIWFDYLGVIDGHPVSSTFGCDTADVTEVKIIINFTQLLQDLIMLDDQYHFFLYKGLYRYHENRPQVWSYLSSAISTTNCKYYSGIRFKRI